MAENDPGPPPAPRRHSPSIAALDGRVLDASPDPRAVFERVAALRAATAPKPADGHDVRRAKRLIYAVAMFSEGCPETVAGAEPPWACPHCTRALLRASEDVLRDGDA